MNSLYSELLRLIYDNLFESATFDDVNNVLSLKTIDTRTCRIIKELFHSYLNLYRMRESRRVLLNFEPHLNKCSGLEAFDNFNAIKRVITPMCVTANSYSKTVSIYYAYNGDLYKCAVTSTNDKSVICIDKVIDVIDVLYLSYSLNYQLSLRQYNARYLSVGFNNAMYFQ